MTAFVPFVQKCLDSTGGSIHAFTATYVAVRAEAKIHMPHNGINMVHKRSRIVLSILHSAFNTCALAARPTDRKKNDSLYYSRSSGHRPHCAACGPSSSSHT